jgi:hypothetical protein
VDLYRNSSLNRLLRKFEEIDSTSDDNLKVVKEKEQKYKELMGDEPSRRIREVANVRLSAYFGNMVKGEDYEWMWSEPIRVDNELSNINSWREVHEKDEAALRPSIQDISSS